MNRISLISLALSFLFTSGVMCVHSSDDASTATENQTSTPSDDATSSAATDTTVTTDDATNSDQKTEEDKTKKKKKKRAKFRRKGTRNNVSSGKGAKYIEQLNTTAEPNSNETKATDDKKTEEK